MSRLDNAPMPDQHPAITVMGVGNTIMGDDGIGVTLLELVEAACDPPGIEFVYGGIGGMSLLPVVQDADHLLILDAVAGTTPGEVRVVTGDQIPRLLSAKLSPHQVGLLDILTAARMLGHEPNEIVVVGIVPESVDLRVGLTQVVTDALDSATRKAVEVIQGWCSAP
ncbi:MAG: HyaD/HybD family hydrogenase maturation endopeptidase [Propionibacteriaceae bacterium]|nr:HyaD/HybD family hydrogenase maturation endopeptidase [Propionibacteriaceae bacterium]